ncbi:hypothetical protein [uncultured Sphingomonas sp.]|uniref:hypothetical protein n=1 Tax=uncultured Sphingomonas sp. TaxID=158754 RepID=UPI0035CBD38F
MRWAGAALLLTAAASGPFDAGDFARGGAAVGDRPSDAIALRQAPLASPSFRLGAAWRGWRNATAAVARDAASPTGDGGDAEVLAEDCSDERIAFIAVEAERGALGLTPEQVGAAATLAPDVVAAWRTRRSAAAPHCPR